MWYCLTRNGARIGVPPVRLLHTPWARAVGLLWPRWPPAHGVWFPGGGAMHTWGMAYPITVAAGDRHGQLLLVQVLPPGRWLRMPRGTAHVWEWPGDWTTVLTPGQQLQWAPCPAGSSAVPRGPGECVHGPLQ